MSALSDPTLRFMRWLLLGMIAVLAPAAMATEPARCAVDDPRVAVVGEYIVVVAPIDDIDTLRSLKSALGGFFAGDEDAYEVYADGGLILLRLQRFGADRTAKRIEAVAVIEGVVDVLAVQPNFRWRAAAGAVAGLGSADWARQRVGADVAEARVGDHCEEDGDVDRCTVVAVLDSGLDIGHEDFRMAPGQEPRLWTNDDEDDDGLDDDGNGVVDDVHGANFYACRITLAHGGKNVIVCGIDETIGDQNGHGTLVAGVLGGRRLDRRPGGVARRHRLMTVRVLDKKNRGTSFSVAAGIWYANRMGAKLINMSLQSPCDEREAVRWAVQNAHANDVATVAAAGNGKLGRDIDTNPPYPAAMGVGPLIAVGATDQQDTLLITSHYGPRTVDLGAPGIDMTGPWLGNGEHTMAGTSFSAPLVSGGLVLLGQLTPNWSWVDRSDYLVAAVRKSNRLAAWFSSSGVLDLDAATSAPVSITSPARATRWSPGSVQSVNWTLRHAPGACGRLEARLSFDDGATFPATPLTEQSTSSRQLSLTVPSPPAGTVLPAAGRLRLTCSGTGLHALSAAFPVQ